MKQALSVASECVPLVKTGGLADVVGALPGAMSAQGWRLRTLLPGYPAVMAVVGKGKALKTSDISGKPVRIVQATVDGLELLVLDAPHLFDRKGSLYAGPDGTDWPDNPLRYAALGWTAAQIAKDGLRGWKPQVIHAHDWQAGLAPLFAKKAGATAGSILTVHNIAFQGIAPPDQLSALRLPRAGLTSEGFEFWGNISALKAGLVHADRITTVSPTYAEELCQPEFGMGLDGVIRARRADLTGVLNGIDTDVWDPATDPHIATYKTARGKTRAKRALEAEFGLPRGDGPLAIVISRLTHQKGLDVLLEALPGFVDNGGRLALLGTGEPALEAAWKRAADHPHVAVHIGYDEPLSHRMMAGADAILIPSRFEPCGLTQLYGLRYGTVPVVARTGGLNDTVIDANHAALRAGVATGIQFAPVVAAHLYQALARLLALYRDQPTFQAMQRRAMAHPVGWGASAADYARLYDQVAG